MRRGEKDRQRGEQIDGERRIGERKRERVTDRGRIMERGVIKKKALHSTNKRPRRIRNTPFITLYYP